MPSTVGRAVRVQLEPHHLGLGAGAEVEPVSSSNSAWMPLQVAAAVGGEERARILPLLAVAEARAPDARRFASHGSGHEGLGLGDADELGRLGAVADVVRRGGR